MEEKNKPIGKLTFEEALAELEELAKNLEDGSLSLEESISCFERGTVLKKYCQGKLEEAERKVEILQKGGGTEKKVRKKRVKVKEDTGEIDDEDIQGSLL